MEKIGRGVVIEPSEITASLDRRVSHGTKSLLLKGQILYLPDADTIVFLCSPVWVIKEIIFIATINLLIKQTT